MLPVDDLTDDDLAEDDLTDDEAVLLTGETDDLVPPARPPMLEDLADDDDIEDLVEAEPLLVLVMDELLTPALRAEEPIPFLPLDEPVVAMRGVWTRPLPGPKKSWPLW